MNKPGIVTAVPRRRLKYGEFSVIILGDVESNDDKYYRYIMAVIRGADPEPGIYITAEQDRAAGQGGTDYTMRIVMRDGAEVIGSSSDWHNLDAFANEALGIVGQLLNLSDEEPYRLM
ncbi:MAG: hypothetical protein HKM88_01605 [Halobacteria archaeon]|nr:hypothetical protein [Halobacteria archaeon]